MKSPYFIFIISVILLILSLTYIPSKTSEEKLTKPMQIKLNEKNRLLFVPLDDRPVNTYVPNKLAKTVGMELLMPTVNTIGKFPDKGNTKAVHNWLTENSKKADGFIISADMLAYGGLTSSREIYTSEEEALENIQILKDLKRKYPEKPLYVYSSLLRLAPTAEDSGSLETYEKIRLWAANGTGEKEIGAKVLSDYKKMRLRNLKVNEKLLSYVEKGYIDYIIFGQDDSSPKGLHQEELKLLKGHINNKMKNKISIFSGTDESGVALLSRFALKQNNLTPSIYVLYDKPASKHNIFAMENIQLDENIKEHIKASGANLVHKYEKADYFYLVRTTNSLSFPSYIKNLTKEGKYISVVDIEEINKGNINFAHTLFDNTNLNSLLSYSAWNTAGNSIGLSISVANTRCLYLSSSINLKEKEQMEYTKNHIELLYRSFLVDTLYKTQVFEQAKTKALKEEDDVLNFNENTKEYELFIEKELNKTSDDFFNLNFKDREFYLTPHGDKVKVENIESLKVNLPWNRLFEVKISPEIQLSNKN